MGRELAWGDEFDEEEAPKGKVREGEHVQEQFDWEDAGEALAP